MAKSKNYNWEKWNEFSGKRKLTEARGSYKGEFEYDAEDPSRAGYSFEEMFKIGRSITHENHRFKITNIMLKGGKKSKMATANEIARIYCKK